MQKTITFLKWNPKRDFYTDNLVCRVKFSVSDTALIGTPRECENVYNITISITDILLSRWQIPGGLDFGITDEMIKVALQSLEDHLAQQLKKAPLPDGELEPLTLNTENSPDTCPYKLANILYPSKTSFVLETGDQDSQKFTSNQINIVGNVTGSTLLIGNDNEVQSSTKIDPQSSARNKPTLILELIDSNGQYKDELTFVQTNNNQDFLFGMALSNITEGSIPAEKLDIHIEISWDGADISKSPKFRATDTYGYAIPGWTATRPFIKQSDVPLPAKLSFHGTNDIRCPFGHPLEWHRFSVVLAEKAAGRFILNYSVSSASPIIENKGKCYIMILHN